MQDTKVTLGGTEYVVPRADLGQIEEIIGVWARTRAESESPLIFGVRQSLDVASILFRDAVPPIDNIRKIRAAVDEVRRASTALMAAAGMEVSVGEDVAGAGTAA